MNYLPRTVAQSRSKRARYFLSRSLSLTTLRFLLNAQQDTSPDQASGYQGFFYHFVNFTTGKRYGDSELSTVDTALLLGGVLFAGGYFDQDHPEEKEIRRMAVACLRVLQSEAPALFGDFELYPAPDGAEAGRVGYHKV